MSKIEPSERKRLRKLAAEAMDNPEIVYQRKRKSFLDGFAFYVATEFGDRCPDHDEECITCTMWRHFDEVKKETA